MIRILSTASLLVFLIQAGLSQGTGITAQAKASGKRATDADRQVLETLLLEIATDPTFPPPATPEKPHIVLHRRTPKMIEPVISASEVSYETGARVLPKDAWDDLVRRNAIRLDPRSREISYEGLAFDEMIQVGNAFPGPEPPFIGKTFEEVFPRARGWVEAWVPGFSKDGRTAVVRARIGPIEKRAMLTAILNRHGDKWAVTWKKYSVYN
jgi:hypothetical protein